MLNGWTRIPLGALCDVLDHLRKPVTKRDRIAGPYPYFGATGVQDFVADYLFDEPLVLVGEDGAKWASGENTAFAVDGKCWVNNHAHVLRPRRDAIVDNWLIYYLNHADLTEFVSGLTVPKLNQGNMREIPIPVPPISEQRRIVGILDEAFDGIAIAKVNAEENLQNARALFESHLNAVFERRGDGWTETTLDEACDNLDSRRIPVTKRDRVAGKYPYYGASGIVDYVSDYIFDEDLLLVSEDGANLLARTYPIAFSVSGKVWVNNHAHVLRFPDIATQRFAEYYLNSISLVPYVNGMAQPKLNQASLNSIPLPLPTLSERKTIVGKLDDLRDQTQRLEYTCERKLAALDALKRSLLDQAFTGRL